jgi:hypothetical protein
MPEFRPSAIKNFFQIELLSSVSKKHYEIIIEEKGKDSTKDQIIRRAN